MLTNIIQPTHFTGAALFLIYNTVVPFVADFELIVPIQSALMPWLNIVRELMAFPMPENNFPATNAQIN